MNAWTEIVDYTVPSNTQSVVLDNFGTITKNDFIKIVTTFVNTGGAVNITMYPNNASTASQYHFQLLYGDGSTAAAVRSTNASLVTTSVSANATVSDIVFLKLSENDRVNTFANTFREHGSGVMQLLYYSTSSGVTFPSGITSLTFNGTIGTGSRIQIYRLDAEKVADITVESNTTQVDISNLSIGKDSEYLLVSDVLYNNPGGNYYLMVNDNTTLSNYYSQRILGSGSSASASRENTARVSFIESAGPTLTYSHIKLSEIGAYTSQNYSIQLYGTSSLVARNDFISSTAENITSITKLNIKIANTNGIKSGSRFELYKLK